MHECLRVPTTTALPFGKPVAGCPDLFYQPEFLDEVEAKSIYSELKNKHPWPANHYEVFGRRFTLPRLQTWHADDGIVYSYNNNLLATRPWSALLQSLRERIEHATGQLFNSVLVNYYRDGGDYVGWHSDDEAEMGNAPVIASLSLGTARNFAFRRRDNKSTQSQLILHPGTLLLMAPDFQHEWEHSVPPDDTLCGRINLTFRFVLPESA